jgi:NADP-reducing hydrogenase subunit HndB
MAKLTHDDLVRIRQAAGEKMALRLDRSAAAVTVHLGTCGIAAGARDVMQALLAALAQSGGGGVRVLAAGCMGRCATEPNVTVTLPGAAPVTYQKMDAEKVRRVVQGHILEGRVQSEYVLA